MFGMNGALHENVLTRLERAATRAGDRVIGPRSDPLSVFPHPGMADCYSFSQPLDSFLIT
jgi:hypothetical protein